MFGKALTAFGARSDVHTNAYSPMAATQTPAAAEPTGAKWNCDKCSNANDAGAMTCNLCSAPRHAPGVPAQAVMVAGRPQSSAFGATPVMPVMPPTSRNQVIPQPSDSDSDGSGEEELVDQQQQQNAQFQMQAPLQFQQQNPQRVVAPLQQAQAAAAAVLAPAADAAAENYSKVMFIMGFFIPLLALYVLL